MKKTAFKIFVFAALSFLTACSTQKNTFVSRSYHNLTAHFNVYFNGKQSFNNGLQKIGNNYKENYTLPIPIFRYSEDDAVKLASSDMDKTLEKMGKTISVHSITVKPKIRGNLTPHDKDFLKKNEYCKWIDDAYLLIGQANVYKRDYEKALRSFRQILNYYKSENTRYDAQLWIAKTYLLENRTKDAYSYLTDLENDPRHPKKLNQQINLSFADYFISQKDFANAIKRLKAGIKLTKDKTEKARYLFIIAQLYQQENKQDSASDFYEKVIKLNTDYDLTFRAKILRATTLSANQKSNDIKRQLKKLLKDEKNEDYKDQIYYAIAIIDQKEKNKTNALENFKLSANSSVNNDNQKALSFLSIANIYFDDNNFLEAAKYYDSTMLYLSKNYTDYDLIQLKAQNTGILAKYIEEANRQDSLQIIAKMPEDKRNALIDSIIAAVIEKEKQAQQNDNQNYFDPLDFNNQNNNNQQDGNKWYFYNPVMVSRGENEFKKKWGNRKLEDNWRRANKNIVVDFDNQDQNQANQDTNRISDNKKREFYLQDLPLTDSAKKVSDSIIEFSLYNAAQIYAVNLKDPASGAATLENLLKRFPNTSLKSDIYFKLVDYFKKANNLDKSEYYKRVLTQEFPQSNYTKILIDPNYFDKISTLEQEAYNTLDIAINAYNENNYSTALQSAALGMAKYPASEAYPNFIFIKAKSMGSLGQKDSMYYYLNYLTSHFPNTNVSKLSEDILKFSTNPLYNYDIYSFNPDEQHFLAILIHPKLNTTEFRFYLKSQAENTSQIRTFEVDTSSFDNNFNLIAIKYFDNAKESMNFYNTLIKSPTFAYMDTTKYKLFAISKSNYDKFIKDKIIDKYQMFFNKNYSKLR